MHTHGLYQMYYLPCYEVDNREFAKGKIYSLVSNLAERAKLQQPAGRPQVLCKPKCQDLLIFTAQCYAKRCIWRRRVSVCLSVCLCVVVSVTLRYCIKTAKHRITQIMPHHSSLTLVFWHQSSRQQMQVGWVKIRHFQRKARYSSKTVQDRCIVSIKVE